MFLDGGPVLDAARGLGAPGAVVSAGRVREAWRAPRVIGRLRAAIRTHRADVVFAHVTKAQLFAAPAARLEGVPQLWWHHELPGQKPVMHALAGQLSSAAVVTSSFYTARLHERGWRRTPIVVIHPGIEASPPEHPRTHAASGEVVLASVGRLQRWKRIELALEALPLVLEQVPGARLEVIGDASPVFDADYPEVLRDRAATLGLDAAVAFRGHVDDVPGALASADVLVHTADGEPFGLVLLEAMQAGVPVIAPDEGGPPEIVREGVDGLLVDPSDRGALAAAIVALARDPERRARMGAAGRERVASAFTAARMAREAWALAGRVAAREPVHPSVLPPTAS